MCMYTVKESAKPALLAQYLEVSGTDETNTSLLQQGILTINLAA